MKEYVPCTCQKDRFATRREAKRHAKDMARKRGFPYGIYQCGPFWHVTSHGEYKKWVKQWK